MTIKELFESASESIDLQALIMFLVFEKKVLSMDDDSKELDLYFLEKHNERMNKELIDFKEKMNMNYPPEVYEIKSDSRTSYILANSEEQAHMIAREKSIIIKETRICDKSEEMEHNGTIVSLRDLTKGKEVGYLGGFDHENIRS